MENKILPKYLAKLLINKVRTAGWPNRSWNQQLKPAVLSERVI